MSSGAGNGGVIPRQPGNSSDLGASVNVDVEHVISSVNCICGGKHEVIPPAIESEVTLRCSGSDYLRDPGEEAEATDSEGRD